MARVDLNFLRETPVTTKYGTQEGFYDFPSDYKQTIEWRNGHLSCDILNWVEEETL